MSESRQDPRVPPALRRVELQNIFSFRSASIDLSELNVLVGPNGAGKSNLLRVIAFMGEVARSDLLVAVDRFGGFDQLLFRGDRKTNTVKMRFEAAVTKYASDNARDIYELSFSKRRSISGSAVYNRNETLLFKRYAGRGRRITVRGSRFYVQEEGKKSGPAKRTVSIDSTSTGLATIRKLGEIYGAEQANELANLFEDFRVFEVDPKRVVAPNLRNRFFSLASNASNLANYLYYLSVERPDLLEAITDDLAAVAPSVRRLHVRMTGLGSDEGYVVELEEAGLSSKTPLAAASFGTIRALALFAMLHDPDPPRLTCIEEIDHGLHPHALDRVVDRLRSAARKTQIIVVTHSPALVNRLDPKELVVFERDMDTGETIIPTVDAESVRIAGAELGLGLGEMWFSGVIGGIPQ